MVDFLHAASGVPACKICAAAETPEAEDSRISGIICNITYAPIWYPWNSNSDLSTYLHFLFALREQKTFFLDPTVIYKQMQLQYSGYRHIKL